MAVLIASVPHMGTFFTANLFEQAGFVLRAEWEQAENNTVHVWHFCEPQTQIFDFLKSHIVVIPLRDELECAKTWKRNGENLSDFYRTMSLMSDSMYASAFRLKIDAHDRDSQLSDLSDLVGVTLTTDWKPINSQNFH